MDDLAVPQNPEELMWYRPSLCPQSPSLLSGSENESDGDAENREGVSMIPPTPERSRPEKRAHSSSRKVSVYTIVCMCIIISILCIACTMCLQPYSCMNTCEGSDPACYVTQMYDTCTMQVASYPGSLPLQIY